MVGYFGSCVNPPMLADSLPLAIFVVFLSIEEEKVKERQRVTIITAPQSIPNLDSVDFFMCLMDKVNV
jgi:hypothetical protein